MTDALLLTAPEADAPFQRLEDMPVRVTAIIGRARVPVRDLLESEPGAILELDRKTGDPVDILVNDRLIARGEIVTIGDRLGVTITELVSE